jgi:phospholipid/cholesterol/gamma-HCH transport system substrate-binding protein
VKVTNETKVGALTVIAIVLLILGYNYLKGNEIFSSTNTYFAVYDNVDGLTPSNAVMMQGLKVGQVRKVTYRADKKLIVLIEINSDLKLTKQDTCKIVATDIFQNKAIELTTSHIGEPAQNGDTLVAYLKPGIGDQISAVVGPIKAKTEKFILAIDSMIGSFSSQLSTGNSGDLKASLLTLKSTLQALNNTAAGMDRMLNSDASKFNQILAHVEGITRKLHDNASTIDKVMKNMAKISDSLAGADLKTTVNNAKDAVKAVTVLLDKINKGEGSVGLLLNDNKLYDNLKSSGENLDKLLIDLKAHPKRYIHFSVFGKKDKATKPQ